MKEKGAKTTEHTTVDSLDGLLTLVQLSVLEIHTWGCHADDIERPDQLVFDLDPDAGLAWKKVVKGAFELRDVLKQLGLRSFLKATGGKGLHVVVPIERRLDWDEVKTFAKQVVMAVEAAHPDEYVTNPLKKVRKGKIFLDYLRNARGATSVAPYSPRNNADANVSTPIDWDELKGGAQLRDFTMLTIPQRLQERGKRLPWSDYGKVKQLWPRHHPGRAARGHLREGDPFPHAARQGSGARAPEALLQKDGQEVPRDHVVRGYELSKGKVVEIEADELKKLTPEATQRIDISDFVKLEEIDPIFYAHTYAVRPGKGGDKAWSLSREAMVKSDRIGIARVVIRTKQSLCALRPVKDGLMLSTMHYADEILHARAAPSAQGVRKSSEKEMAMALQLIDALASPFKPEQYKDEDRDEVLELIRKKSKGKLEGAPEQKERPSQVIDLAEALAKSLAKRSGASANHASGGHAAHAKKAAPKRHARAAGRR